MKLSLFFAVMACTAEITSTTTTTPITEMKSFSVTRAIETATPTASPSRIRTTRRPMATTKARATGTSLATTKAHTTGILVTTPNTVNSTTSMTTISLNETNTNFTTETSTNFTTAISNGTSTPRRREYGTTMASFHAVGRYPASQIVLKSEHSLTGLAAYTEFSRHTRSCTYLIALLCVLDKPILSPTPFLVFSSSTALKNGDKILPEYADGVYACTELV
ncbi:uncharacterized protein LOC142590271 isoform X7 [Dermacentor variabilis]|uniref:uncharacterized protein LOC142590271 isoform X7 n=1 Tax=Dermacentor variabilis TaxID=34621 RepID=UPI003F5AFAFE